MVAAPSRPRTSSGPPCSVAWRTASGRTWPADGLPVSSSRGAAARFSLRGGEGDLHPFANWQASLFARQMLAWERCGPAQVLHLVTACAHAWPHPAWHPPTGHRWSDAWWTSRQRVHLGSAAERWEAMWPTHSTGCRRRLVGPPQRARPRGGCPPGGHSSSRGGLQPPPLQPQAPRITA